MTTDGALLALIVDDNDSIRVLAAWGALAHPIAAIDDHEVLDQLAGVAGISTVRTRTCLFKLRAARVLVDGGISDLADKMLQSHVQQRIGGKKGKR